MCHVSRYSGDGFLFGLTEDFFHGQTECIGNLLERWYADVRVSITDCRDCLWGNTGFLGDNFICYALGSHGAVDHVSSIECFIVKVLAHRLFSAGNAPSAVGNDLYASYGWRVN